MPAGLEVMVPVPVPLLVTVRAKLWSVNVAVTLLTASIGTVHVVVPVQAPLQPLKLEPVAGVAVRVTLLPEMKSALQVAPQSMPVGLLVTVPVPVPALVRVRV
jgi:hypothetical protein